MHLPSNGQVSQTMDSDDFRSGLGIRVIVFKKHLMPEHNSLPGVDVVALAWHL